MAHWTNIGGITVLVDQDGKPLLDPRYAGNDRYPMIEDNR